MRAEGACPVIFGDFVVAIGAGKVVECGGGFGGEDEGECTVVEFGQGNGDQVEVEIAQLVQRIGIVSFAV